MNRNGNQPGSPELSPGPSPTRTPGETAAEIVAWIRAGITLVRWTVVALVTLAGAFVILKATWWAIHVILRAIGI